MTGLAGAARAQTGMPWAVWESPGRLALLDPRVQVLERSSFCLDGCRYDRSSPESRRFLYALGDEDVLFEDVGPGALTRLWMTTGFGVSQPIPETVRVRFYLDGEPLPRLDVPLASLFDGSLPPFTPPLAVGPSQASGGYLSYLPIPYAQGMRITLAGARSLLLWFQLVSWRLPAGMPVSSFEPGQDPAAWRAFLAHAGDDPWARLALPAPQPVSLQPGEVRLLAAHDGPGWLRGISLRVPPAVRAELALRVVADGLTRVDLALDRYFSAAAGDTLPMQGPLLGTDDAGALYSWFPMPFGFRIEVLADARRLTTAVELEAALAFESDAAAASAAGFEAQAIRTCPSIPAVDLPLSTAHGAGKLVGLGLEIASAAGPTREYLEGDERAYLDGRRDPSWYGTGVEDFFNGGFYFDGGAYRHPLSAATRVDPDGSGATRALRLLPSDPLPWQQTLDLRLEAGPTGLLPVCATATAYQYRQPGPALVPYDRLELGDAVARQRWSYQAPPDAACQTLVARYVDEPPTSRGAVVCHSSQGVSRFRLSLAEAAPPLRLRRVVDAATPGQVADVWVNGGYAGGFPFVAANPARRWVEQDLVLPDGAAATSLDFEVRPRFGSPLAAAGSTESAYELWGPPRDLLFRDGFETAGP